MRRHRWQPHLPFLGTTVVGGGDALVKQAQALLGFSRPPVGVGYTDHPARSSA
jgi:hypothetical protein